MSKQQHTPWRYECDAGQDGAFFYSLRHGAVRVVEHKTEGRSPGTEDYFRRIVACVNALAGFSTEDIESGAWREAIRNSEE